MDEHAQRVTESLRRVWSDFQAGQAGLLDLASAAGTVAGALDNAHVPLVDLLRRVEAEAESAYFSNETSEHQALGRELFTPVIEAIDAL